MSVCLCVRKIARVVVDGLTQSLLHWVALGRSGSGMKLGTRRYILKQRGNLKRLGPVQNIGKYGIWYNSSKTRWIDLGSFAIGRP